MAWHFNYKSYPKKSKSLLNQNPLLEKWSISAWCVFCLILGVDGCRGKAWKPQGCTHIHTRAGSNSLSAVFARLIEYMESLPKGIISCLHIRIIYLVWKWHGWRACAHNASCYITTGSTQSCIKYMWQWLNIYVCKILSITFKFLFVFDKRFLPMLAEMSYYVCADGIWDLKSSFFFDRNTLY